jgi:hypothetical protein
MPTFAPVEKAKSIERVRLARFDRSLRRRKRPESRVKRKSTSRARNDVIDPNRTSVVSSVRPSFAPIDCPLEAVLVLLRRCRI